MVSRILHETQAFSRRSAACLLLISSSPVWPAAASPLFDDDSVLDIELSGPLWPISKNRDDEERVEYPFAIAVDGAEIPVDIRVRGKSRTVVCSFPPLRLNFSDEGTAGTVFEGQDKLKLVTHCRSGKEKYENDLLEEYTAYRIFNLLSDTSYRVRLLRIRYEDTAGKSRHLDQTYFAFLIESDEELASRVGGEIALLSGVPLARLNEEQTARLYVFQYLVANFDWSLVVAEGADSCCHNVDLIRKEEQLFPIPYDFDRSGLVDASYTKVPKSFGTKRATERVYRGYCKLDIGSVAAALDEIVALRDEIMDLVANSPVAGDEDTSSRVRFIGNFFERALEERDDMLYEFDSDCVEPH